MSTMKDLTGQVFGRLKVTSFAGARNGHSTWNCVCLCENEVVVQGRCLKSGATRSCGCLQKERTIEAHTTHGLRGTAQYWAWHGAKDRVTNPNNPAWKDYGGRGIKMCQEWEDSFEAFWRDMGPTWQEGLTIERKDTDGNYCPENCKWDTESHQNHNKRKWGKSSKYKGVYLNKDNCKFKSGIAVDGKKIHLGYFINETDAAVSYDNASEELYGDRPNGTTRDCVSYAALKAEALANGK